ncbi:MAG: F0F1 ATP synthase subunit delta [Cellulosilyticaceae bacterium]
MAELITKRYATALFDIATETNKAAQFEQEASMIYDILVKEPEFLQILNHPNVLQDEKVKLVENVFEGRVSDEFVGLLVLTVRKSRQDLILEILNKFLDMVKEANGTLKATVTSAISLNDGQLAQIKSNIEKDTNKQIELTAIVDKSIIGGLIIRVGDKVIDGSVAGQMQALKSKLNDLRLA